MTAQRELNDRVANAHLSDFQEQLHTQTISTVSFAYSQLPLQAPSEPPPLPAGARGTLPGAPRPSPALDTMAPPTGAMIPAEDVFDLADGTGTSVRQIVPPRRGRRHLYYAIAGGAAVVLVAVVAFAMLAGGRASTKASASDAAASAAGSAPQPKKQEITIIPIDPPPPPPPPLTPAQGSADAIHGSPAQVSPGSSAGAGSGSAKSRPVHTARPAGLRDPDRKLDKKPELTREAVAGRFSAARREYDAFKIRNGDRLEREWGDLATFMTYQLTPTNLEDALRRIETFRAKLRE
jgi:hypothetical protein